jgi:sn-glycerol 3-phosphate transport system permease protein
MGAVGAASATRSASTPSRRGGKRGGFSAKETLLALLFLAPSIAVFAVFFYKPFFNIMSWGRYQSLRGGAAYKNVGLSQYRHQLGGSDFRAGVWHTVQFVLYTVPAGLILGTLLAVAANRTLKGIKVFQAIFTSTIASSVAVTSVVFFFLFNPTSGAVPLDWLQRTHLAMLEVAIPTIWQNLGLSFVIVLAGLQAVPDEVIEAARLDGYGAVRRLWKITLPLISPVLLFLLVVLVIQGFQAYAQIELISRGGPAGATETVVYKIFQLNKPDSIGIGSVYAVGLFFLTLIVTTLQFAILERRVHYVN